MNRKWNTEKFKLKLEELHGDEYTLMTEYETSDKHVILKHNVCNKEYRVTPNNFLGGIGWCSHCAIEKRKKKMTKTFDEFREEVKLISKDYEVYTYKTTNEKIEFLHKVCNSKFMMTPSNFLQGQRCPKCLVLKAIDILKKKFRN